MKSSENLIEKMKKLSRENGKEYTDQEAKEAADNLTGIFDLLWKFAKEDSLKEKRLRKEPNGFPIESDMSCRVCGIRITPENGWYDKYGAKCPLCRKAVADGTIPTFVCINRDSYLEMWKLTHDLNVKTPTIKKFIKEGRLHARVVLTEEGRPHYYIFLRKENPELIVPNNPARKSYDKHRAKLSRKWAKETAEEWKKDLLRKTR